LGLFIIFFFFKNRPAEKLEFEHDLSGGQMSTTISMSQIQERVMHLLSIKNRVSSS